MSTPTGVRRPTGTSPGTAGGRRWIVLSVVTWAVLLDGLAAGMGPDTAAAARTALRIGDAAMPTVQYGYGLLFLLALVPGGRLGDVFGPRRAFLAGAWLFTLGSLLCAAAPGPGTLTGGRLVQGMAAALMIPQVLAVVMTEFAPHEHARRVAGYALYGVVVAFVAPASGLLSDALTGGDVLGLGWRGFFGVLVAAAVFLAVAAAVIRWRPPGPRARFDAAGTVLSVLGLVLLVFPLTAGGSTGWPAWTFASIVLSLPVFAVLVWRQRHRERTGRSPLIVPSLFLDRAFARGMVVIIVMSFTILGFFPFLSGYLGTTLGFSPAEVWLASIGWPVGILIAAFADVRLAARSGRVLLLAGGAMMTVGVAVLIPVFAHNGSGTQWRDIAWPLLIAGLGKGLMTPAMIHLVLARVPAHAVGSASGTLLAVQQVGGLVGFAVLGSVLHGMGPALSTEVAGLVVVTFSLLLFPRGGPPCHHPREANP